MCFVVPARAGTQGPEPQRSRRGSPDQVRGRPWAGLLALLLALCSPISAAAQAPTEDGLGRTVFLETAVPNCAVCHALADAGASGELGPDLDSLRPTEEQVSKAVTNGIEAMPAYEDLLTEEQIEAVSRYVARVAGQGQ